jgi:hypothetical protein
MRAWMCVIGGGRTSMPCSAAICFERMKRYCAALAPATRPNTTQSSSELPPRRLRPWMPPATSPAAKSPGMASDADALAGSGPERITSACGLISRPPMQ